MVFVQKNSSSIKKEREEKSKKKLFFSVAYRGCSSPESALAMTRSGFDFGSTKKFFLCS